MNVAPNLILALMIGELEYQPTINRISQSIVEHAVAAWRKNPAALLVCESEPMTAAARALGVPAEKVMTALPQDRGHTTRLVAEWLSRNRTALPDQPWLICTHKLHASRASRVLRKSGLAGTTSEIDTAFDGNDADWKLRSRGAFLFYNLLAEIYCRWRGWV